MDEDRDITQLSVKQFKELTLGLKDDIARQCFKKASDEIKIELLGEIKEFKNDLNNFRIDMQDFMNNELKLRGMEDYDKTRDRMKYVDKMMRNNENFNRGFWSRAGEYGFLAFLMGGVIWIKSKFNIGE